MNMRKMKVTFYIIIKVNSTLIIELNLNGINYILEILFKISDT